MSPRKSTRVENTPGMYELTRLQNEVFSLKRRVNELAWMVYDGFHRPARYVPNHVLFPSERAFAEDRARTLAEMRSIEEERNWIDEERAG
jgi:hypothetical protein